ncbi:MAG: DUF6351 family protein [Gemmatimonadota bacterium]
MTESNFLRNHKLPRVLTVASLLVAAGCASGLGDADGGAGLTIETVPTQPAYISGGDALIRVSAPAEIDLERIAVSVNGTPAADFRAAPADPFGRSTHALLGIVTGLREGTNEVVASIDGSEAGSLTVTNYPLIGPIFSGEQLEPYFCLDQLQPDDDGSARRFAIGNGEFIEGPAAGDGCGYATRVDYLYLPSGEGADFQPLADPASPPANAAQVETGSGATVPLVVRLETGTINRAIYQTAMLVDPANPDPDPWAPASGWNGRLVYTFGGGCEAGFFQGTSTGGVLRDDLLSRGYAVASSTLNVNAQGGCNDPLSAETTMMVKERFAETYGPPVHTIGWGGSGGAMQQLLIAGAYPGILDGIMPTATFPDAVSYLIDSSDCLPLRDFLNSRELDEQTKSAVGGWAVWATCDRSLGGRPNRASPGDCPEVIPVEARYDAAANPAGVRCSVFDGMRNVFGTKHYEDVQPDPAIEFGRAPLDNVGVQYGLEALNAGLVSTDLFLDVNENVGGWNVDFERRAERAEADPAAVRAAYETGRITSGAGGLAITPIIDERTYTDPTGDFHTSYYSFVMRERLVRDNGHADNYILLRRPRSVSRAYENLALMDEWLTNLALDEAEGARAEKVVRSRPAALAESCWDEEGGQIAEPQTYDPTSLFDNTAGHCNALYPPHTGPRMVAGGPLTNDVLKCRLRPLDRSAYEVSFTDEEWARLEAIFPQGVCDWSRPGLGQDLQVRTWLSFGPSPVNRYTPPE